MKNKQKYLAFMFLIFLLIIPLASCGINSNFSPEPEPGDSGEPDQPPQHLHEFGEWMIVQESTCIKEGEMVRYCNCGEKQTEAVRLSEHTVITLKGYAATCKDTGLTDGEKCSVCGEIIVEQQPIDMKNHTPITVKGYAATCKDTGLTDGEKCSVCDEILVKQETVKANGHTEIIDEAVKPTCTETGLTEGKHCGVCGEVLIAQGVVSTLPHTYDNKYDESCNVCGFIRDAECPHTSITILSAKAATCTETGLTEGKHCSLCNEVIIAQTIVPANGHTDVVDEAIKPTCTETGLTEGKHCSVCDKVLVSQKTVKANGHTEVIDEAVKPTCTETGLAEGKHCSVCDEVIVAQTTVSAKGHTIVIDKAVAPTCTKTGLTEGKHCSVCHKIIVAQTIVPANGHTYTVTVTDPTCEKQGYTTHICFCGDKYVDNYTDIVSCKYTNCVCMMCGKIEPTSYEYFKFALREDGTYSISAKNASDMPAKVGIPSTYNGKAVTNIASFSGCTNLTSVSIPDSVTSISDYAFSGCKSLTGVYITDIAAWCNISFGNSTSNPLYYAKKLYFKGELVTELKIPTIVTSISDYAFSGCSFLTSVTIPNSIVSIGLAAFDGCTSLTNVEIPDSVASIKNDAFLNCISLNYNEYSNAYYLGNENNPYIVLIKAKSTDITSCTIHENTKFIHSSAFEYCESLTSITIPDRVKSIDWGTFKNCESLVSVSFGNNSQLLSIDNSAFAYCDRLTNITIPDSVTSIAPEAFIINLGIDDNKKYNEYGNAYYLGNENNPYVVLMKAKSRDITSCIIRKETKVIASYAFNGCTSLTSIVIPDSVTSIGQDAFNGCTSLKSVIIGDSVTNIGHHAFSGCTSLTSVTIGDSVTNIGHYAFSGCTSLTGVYITDIAAWCNISFGDYTSNPLDYAKKLYLNGKLVTELVIPEGITEIKEYAFFNCTSLTSVSIPDSVTSIGKGAFSNCKSLTSITIPKSVMSIDMNAFSNCSSLTDVYYTGDKNDWGKITILSFNDYLTDATIHYNHIP